MKRFVFAALLATTSPAFAEIETGRDYMDAKQFDKAMAELLPAANSGNAAFFAPLIAISPRSAGPPCISRLSISFWLSCWLHLGSFRWTLFIRRYRAARISGWCRCARPCLGFAPMQIITQGLCQTVICLLFGSLRLLRI